VELVISNRTAAKALALAAEVGAATQNHLDLQGYDLVLNTTSAGLSSEPLELVWPTDHRGVAYDVFYQESETAFLAGARQAGWHTIDGREMLAAQGARSLSWWLGRQVPRELLRRGLP
jgi:shikimate dehydrogenase